MTFKSLMAWPLLRIKMIRVGLGFTVHSPFAYHFIKCCLKERLPYYAFIKLVTDKADRRLFRIVAYFNPSTVCYIGNADHARRIISLACPHVREVNAAADFIYVNPGEQIPPEFKVIYAEQSAARPSGAMTFTNGSQTIAVRRPGLPAQSFRLRF